MAGIATGVFKRLYVKRQAGLGVIAPPGPAGSAQSLRRVTSTLDKTKASYQSNEVIQSQQVRDMRHGVGSTAGTLSCELSVGTYQDLFESVLRKDAVAIAGPGALNNVSAVSTGIGTGRFTRDAGSFIADGFKVGDVINVTGFTAPATENNDQYCVIVSLVPLSMNVRVLDKSPVVAKAAGDPVVISIVGKKIWVPEDNQTRDYYTFEHWFSDIGVDEVFRDTVVGGANIALPPTGMATVEFPLMGLAMIPGNDQYFTAPAPPSKGGILAAVNGVLIIDGEPVGLVTGLTIAITGNYAFPSGDGVVGSDERPDVLPGTVIVTGQMTVLFSSARYRDAFLNEEEASLAMVFTTSNVAKPDFTAFVMSRVKYSGSTKDDTNTGMTLTMPFQALENVTTGGDGKANLQTTISIQDSTYA